MRIYFVFQCLLIGLIANISLAQNTFNSERELSEYVFSQTDLTQLTTEYFLNFPVMVNDSSINYFRERSMPNSENSANDLLVGLSLLENADYRTVNRFNMDSVLFPVMDNYYSVAPQEEMRIPLFILANQFASLTHAQKTVKDNWNSTSPYPSFNTNEMIPVDLYQFGLFMDTLVNNNIAIYWDQNTFISNINGLEITSVQIKIDGSTYLISEGQSFDLTPYYSDENPLTDIPLQVQFNNGKRFSTLLTCYFKKDPNTFNYPSTSQQKINSVHVDYLYYPGCIDLNPPGWPPGVTPVAPINTTDPALLLDKPLILVSGWGPYTDLGIINNDNQWPASIPELYENFNSVSKKIDVLREQGYDVILVRFHPPNASIHDNSERLEAVINLVNQIKVQNGSHQENVIMGYSAGALCAKFTLLRIEKNHLENNGPHHHSKLFISMDGENQGAHIPLSMQAAVQDFRFNLIGLFGLQLKKYFAIYALYYILDAPLSQELLKYYQSETGTIGNPGQGQSYLRTNYLNVQSSYNHSKNSHIPDYPSFTRNISISNGRNEPNDLFDQDSYFPYQNEGFHWFSGNSGPVRNVDAYFEKQGGGVVYRRQYISFGNWQVSFARKTNANVWVLDNAPGGAMEVDRNPLKQLVDVMKSYTANDPIAEARVQYCFTPALLTHDIQNFNPVTTGGRMEYDFKNQGLMYQNKDDADDNNLLNASDFYGYPHLRYPNNHYSDYTPFDAVYTGPENTEHISTKTITETSPGSREYEVDPSPYSATKDTLRNFILDECDAHGIAKIQNKRYGWNARSNYLYEADIIVPVAIKIGNRVTQRTNFNDVEIWDNAKVYAQAGEEIHITNGFHAQSGSEFHAIIAPNTCINFNPDPFLFVSNSNNPNAQYGYDFLDLEENEHKNDNWENLIHLFPNPSSGLVNLEISNNHNHRYSILISDMHGKIVRRIEDTRSKINLNLDEGIYILKVNIQNQWHTKKVVII